ncbi:hypothetical protein OF897_11910 [Chryseobacterium formosus]|uniref:Uncharacterized protein n=1 Tax=Chryseobacterium formosus TaxID=1537363 RepID=A0ABT3XU31_9FLAO|nr:hypothetical protein [Chryseobacterium formosus]MCX8524619.1 hypothetical protein [Chryseobacterium formosus]
MKGKNLKPSIMLQYPQNKKFLDAVKKLSVRHNIDLSEILSIAQNTESKNRMDVNDLNHLQNNIGIPLGIYLSKKEVCKGLVNNTVFQNSLISIANSNYSFQKLDHYPNFIWSY